MPKLRFDGYYFYLNKKENPKDTKNYILRFYEKSQKVISVSVGLNNNKVKNDFNINDFFPSEKWFNEDYEKSGIYEISGDKIRFYTQSKNGHISYKGEILDNRLELFSHSYINGYETKILYNFIPFEEIKK